MTSEWPYTRWALEQIADRAPGRAEMVAPSVQGLVDAVRALRATGPGQLFGLSIDRLEDEGRPEVEAAALATLIRWKHHFEAESDSVSLQALDEVGAALALPDLRAGRFPLLCDPLGSRDGLSAAWRLRLARLDEAIAGRRHLDLVAVHVVGADDEEDEDLEVEFGRPDPDMLYKVALRYEAESELPFPRELAAFWSTVDGIFVDGDPLLRPIAHWDSDIDGRLSVGCGGYMQGNLVFEDPPDGDLMRSAVVDIDDDGQERARYADFAAFADALLGTD